ncbi:cell division cycle- protein [Myotisia sp. PD_48]|nr:cell division cycle- protein [Myotisia sp. PD_48]
MEQSSPLAAMQPPSLHFGHCFQPDSRASFGAFPSVKRFGPDSFNFKDLAMKGMSPDYFNIKPIHGPSPTVSLAADLSQNFHIDQSPRIATPRRTLFSAKLFCMDNDSIPTPIPSSSPADFMDMSPLPHKPPFSAHLELDLESPTTELSLAKSQPFSNQSSLQESPMDEDTKPASQPERRRPPFLRPSLMRGKAVITAPRGHLPQPPAFKFAAGGSKLSMGPSISLAEIFEESPSRDTPSERGSPAASCSPAPLRTRTLHGMLGHSRPSGFGPNRAISKPYARPRKLSRRSLSMFEHPADVMKDNLEETTLNASSALQSITDMNSAPTLNLPHFIPEDQPDCLPRIESNVLVDLVNGKYSDKYDNVTIIDCRFEYEYEGGHIDGAVNYNDKEQLAAELFNGEPKPNTVLILHCEYSAHRAPIMAQYIRHRDRAVNVDEYPKLTFPEMYILHGGYSAFFTGYRSLCFPQNYVEMASKEHEFACERGLGKVKQRSKLSRAQTFAFGQQTPQMEDSPTGRCRRNAERNLSIDSPLSRAYDSGRIAGRRMFSY